MSDKFLNNWLYPLLSLLTVVAFFTKIGGLT
jgi:hypothetical protein